MILREETMRIQYATLLLTITLLLGACAEPAPWTRVSSSAIKRFGVVSVAADVLTRQYIGLTVFGNELDELDVSSRGDIKAQLALLPGEAWEYTLRTLTRTP